MYFQNAEQRWLVAAVSKTKGQVCCVVPSEGSRPLEPYEQGQAY